METMMDADMKALLRGAHAALHAYEESGYDTGIIRRALDTLAARVEAAELLETLAAAEAERDAALAREAELREALEEIRRGPSDASADWPELVEWMDREAAAALQRIRGAGND